MEIDTPQPVVLLPEWAFTGTIAPYYQAKGYRVELESWIDTEEAYRLNPSFVNRGLYRTAGPHGAD